MTDNGSMSADALAANPLVARAARGSPGHMGAQSRAVIIWKAIEYVGLALFTVVMPRLMRPELYGRFAAILSIIGLVTMAAAMGAQATFGRFVPEFEARGEHERTRVLFTQLFGLRVAAAFGLGLALFLAFPHVLRGGVTPLSTAAAGAGTFFCVAVGMVCFQLFYGLNRLGRSLAHDGMIRLVLIGLVLALGGTRSLDRAVLALFVAEFAFFVVGLLWARPYLTRSPAVREWSGLSSQLSFGLTFFGANLLLMSVWRGGELAVLLLSGRSAEVAFYSVANAVALAFAALLGQLGALLLPSLTMFHVSGESERVGEWLGLALKYLTISAFAFALVVHALGAWLVHTLLGDSYLPVVANLKVLSLGLLPIGLVRIGIAVAMVRLEQRKAVVMAAGGAIAFVALAAVLVPESGSRGASIAAALAVGVTAALAYALFGLRPTLGAARFWRLTACGLFAFAVLELPWAAGPLTGLAALGLFAALLFGSGVVRTAELRRLAGAIVT